MQTIKKLIIKTPQGTSGVLSKDGRFSFRYENQNDASREISLTMPLRFNDYASTNLHPVFESCRPEGFNDGAEIEWRSALPLKRGTHSFWARKMWC